MKNTYQSSFSLLLKFYADNDANPTTQIVILIGYTHQYHKFHVQEEYETHPPSRYKQHIYDILKFRTKIDVWLSFFTINNHLYYFKECF
jgi:hypothetical protein